MKLAHWFAVLAWIILIACDTVPTPQSEPTIASPSALSGGRDLSIPGGGQILFVPSQGPGYPWEGIGVLEADGSIRRFEVDGSTFPYWDPAGSDRLLTLSFNEPRPEAQSFEFAGDSLHLVESWRTSEIFVFPSPDGETIAYTPVDRSGHQVRIGIMRLVDRSTGTTKTIRSDGLVPLDWTPDGKLLAAPRSGGKLMLWDPTNGEVAPFGNGRFSSLAWSSEGNRFAATIIRGGKDASSVVVIGAPDGRVVDRVFVTHRWVEMPTWSPDGGRVAFIVRGPEPQGHRTATLHVYDVARGIDSVVARRVSDAFWASWSPDGRWLLVEDWTRARWLFIAADGSERIPYPWLGTFPRWCCPSSPGWVPIPVS